jgi:hypothetical protein
VNIYPLSDFKAEGKHAQYHQGQIPTGNNNSYKYGKSLDVLYTFAAAAADYKCNTQLTEFTI